METTLTIVVIFLSAFQFDLVNGGIASTWSSCRCSWGTWKDWSNCTRSCYGKRIRTRVVWTICSEFTDCASNDMGYQIEGCNEVCQNGGYYNGTTCICALGFYGNCCVYQVNCGAPSSITNGYITGSVYTYGRTISYFCNTGYNITGGDATRTCQTNSVWSGTKPRCGYVNSCSSNPCKNGATCTNIIDGYRCTCGPGWSGATCTIDVQPPVAVNCSEGINVTTADRTEIVNWLPPIFNDPMGQTLTVHTNYPQNSYEFRWGDFPVQYVAVKPSNAKSSECLFEVKVRPNPCPVLPPPVNGARVCNNWKTDYGLYCLVFCTGNNTLSRGVSFGDWFVCGASGIWSPSGAMPGCIAKTRSEPSSTSFKFESCNNQTEISTIKKTYIEHLKSSEFNEFCQSFKTLCTEDNVSVLC